MIYLPIIIIAIVMGLADAQAGYVDPTDFYIKTPPKAKLSKYDALRELLISDNKEKVYRCRMVKVSDKGTVRYK